MSNGLPPLGYPQTEDEYLAALLKMDQEQPEAPAQAFPGGARPGFLEHLATSFQGGVPQPSGFAGGLLSGLVGGLASQGQKQAEARARFDASMATRQAERDRANLEATRRRREELLKGLNDVRAEERAYGREIRDREAADRRAAFQEPTETIVGPDGKPIIVRRSNAIGKEGFQPPKAGEGPKPLGSSERDAVTQDNLVISQTDNIRKGFNPEWVGPSSELRYPSFKASPERARFASDLSQWTSNAIHQLYGGNLTPNELARVTPQFPQMTDPPDNFLAKLENAQQRLREKAAGRRKTYSETGLDVSGLSPIPEIPAPPAQRPPLRSFMRP